MKKIGILFGGKSDEHEISILSASSVIGAVDSSRYEIIPVGISKSGDWYHITDDVTGIETLEDERLSSLIPSDGEKRSGACKLNLGDFKKMIDFAFPVLHGPYGEDGTVQGVFEMMDIPYAGCGVTASALSMDKIFAKEIWQKTGLPVCRHISVKLVEFNRDRGEILSEIEHKLGFPVFVKPANMGSSVGIGRAEDRDQLAKSIQNAFGYDSRVIVEEEIKGRELETAILGNDIIMVGAVGEIVTGSKFYDYESKYRGAKTELFIPACISEEKSEEIRDLAEKAFETVGGSGFSRVDFFLEESTDKVYINEINTIPGFTKYSMFPLLWKEAGINYRELIERIIELGYERYNAKNSRKKNRS